ncbi:MAG TPA: CpXC domain-containing protein [Nitrospirota bacterium]|nr:CpXC domain-containing protein [Nitrospirota bacterium]
MLTLQSETHSNVLLYCVSCRHTFQARIVTWVDVARTPHVKTLLQNEEFNIVTCPHCGNRQFSDSSFFYEDFAEGLLVAVFPKVPENRLFVEARIKQKYGYYPTLEFFYDMTQLWVLLYLQEHYKEIENLHAASKIAWKKRHLQTFLQFIKKDPLMLAIRETLTEAFLGNKTNDDLQNVLWYALVKLECMSFDISDAQACAALRAT